MKRKPRQQEALVTADTPRITRRGWLKRAGTLALGASVASRFGSFSQLAHAAADSAKGSKLLVEGGAVEGEALRGLFVVDPEVGTWIRIVADAGQPARLSPDGSTLAFRRSTPDDNGVRGNAVWLCNVDGNDEPRKLAEPGTWALWSPDGRELLVSGATTRASREFESTIMQRDGSGRRKLDLPKNELVIDWSADGKWLLTQAFSIPGDGARIRGGPKVMSRKLDGSSPTLLVESDNYAIARFAPDSERLVFTRVDQDDPKSFSLWICQRDGTGMRKLVAGTAKLYPFFTCWSPDGKWLAVDMSEVERDDEGATASLRRRVQLFSAEGKPGRKIELPQAQSIPLDWR